MSDPQDPMSVAETNRLFAEARQLLDVGKVAEAEEILRTILDRNENEIQALVGLGIVLAQSNRKDAARDLFQRATQIDPQCLPALTWLSFLLRESGQLDQATRYAETAVASQPQNPAAHVALARCYKAVGRFKEAANEYRAALADGPQSPAILYELAEIMPAAGLERESIDVLRSAISMNPSLSGLLQLGNTELGLDLVQNSKERAEQAIVLDPNSAGAHALLARVWLELGQNDEADLEWKAVEELEKGSATFTLERAFSLSAVGRFEEAKEGFRRSIELNPNQGSAFQGYVFAKKADSEDQTLIRQMERVLVQPSTNPQERVALLFALARSHENVGGFEKAMQFYDEANFLTWRINGASVFDRSAFRQLIDERIKLFSPGLFADRRFEPNDDSDLPLIVAGMMRSGTTLTEQMISCHPEVCGTGEQYFWADQEGSIVDYPRKSVDAERLSSAATEYVKLLSSLGSGSSRVIDKNPINFLFFGLIHLGLPNARIVHTKRALVDIALSIWTTPLKTDAPYVNDRGSIVFALEQYSRLMDHWRKVIPKDRLLDVQYESLVADPEPEIRRVVEFLGLSWDESCLRPESNRRRVKTPSFWQVRQPLYSSSVKRWKRFEPWLGEFADLLSE